MLPFTEGKFCISFFSFEQRGDGLQNNELMGDKEFGAKPQRQVSLDAD